MSAITRSHCIDGMIDDPMPAPPEREYVGEEHMGECEKHTPHRPITLGLPPVDQVATGSINFDALFTRIKVKPCKIRKDRHPIFGGHYFIDGHAVDGNDLVCVEVGQSDIPLTGDGMDVSRDPEIATFDRVRVFPYQGKLYAIYQARV